MSDQPDRVITRQHETRQLVVEWLAVALIFGATSALSIAFQHPLSINDGKGWDGMYYYDMVGIAKTWITTRGSEYYNPFAYRIGTPFLVMLVSPGDVFGGFHIVNQAANITFAILFVIWLRYFITDWRIRVLISGLMITHYNGLIRFYYFYPIHVDYWALTLLLAGLLLMYRERLKPHWSNLAGLTVLMFVGLFFKESIMIIPTAFLISNNPIRSATFKPFAIKFKKPLYYSLPLIAAVAAVAIMHKTIRVNEGYYLAYMILMATTKSPVTFIVGVLYAFGPALGLPLLDWKRQGKFLLAHLDLAIFLLLGLGMTWVGGADTERIALTMSPVIYALVGIAIENLKNVITIPLAGLLGAAQALAQRLFWTMPDYPSAAPSAWPIFVVQGNYIQLFDLSSYQRPDLAVVVFIEYVALCAIVIMWIQIVQRRRHPSISDAVYFNSSTDSELKGSE